MNVYENITLIPPPGMAVNNPYHFGNMISYKFFEVVGKMFNDFCTLSSAEIRENCAFVDIIEEFEDNEAFNVFANDARLENSSIN